MGRWPISIAGILGDRHEERDHINKCYVFHCATHPPTLEFGLLKRPQRAILTVQDYFFEFPGQLAKNPGQLPWKFAPFWAGGWASPPTRPPKPGVPSRFAAGDTGYEEALDRCTTYYMLFCAAGEKEPNSRALNKPRFGMQSISNRGENQSPSPREGFRERASTLLLLFRRQ